MFCMILSFAMKTGITVVLVDMGGVLARHEDSCMEKALLHDFGLHGFDSFSQLDESLPELLLLLSKSIIDEKQMWEMFTRKTGKVVPHYDGSLWAKYFHPSIDADMLSLLVRLKQDGYRVVCATNTEPAHYAYHMNHGQYEVFDTVYASCIIKKAKPEEAFFTHILDAEGIEAGNALLVDDTLVNCRSAERLGIHAVHYTGISQLREKIIHIGILDK